jgi:hypothetical protein
MDVDGAHGESGCFDDDACGDAGSLDCDKKLCNIVTSTSTKKLVFFTFTPPAHVDVSPQLRGCESDELTDVVVHMAGVALSLTTAVTVASRRMACVALVEALQLGHLSPYILVFYLLVSE